MSDNIGTKRMFQKDADIITATCSICGYTEDYECSEEEAEKRILYSILGREMGAIQDVFPKIPAWIRSGALDQYSAGFCICPSCLG